MSEFAFALLTAIGLVFVIEGVVYSLFPNGYETNDDGGSDAAIQPTAFDGPYHGVGGFRHRLAGALK